MGATAPMATPGSAARSVARNTTTAATGSNNTRLGRATMASASQPPIRQAFATLLVSTNRSRPYAQVVESAIPARMATS